MKMILMIGLLVSFSAYSNASETQKGVKKDYEQFKVEMTQELNEAEIKITELKLKTQEKGSETKDKTIKELERSRDELKASLEKMESSSKQGWAKFKKKFANSVDRLNQKVQKSLED